MSILPAERSQESHWVCRYPCQATAQPPRNAKPAPRPVRTPQRTPPMEEAFPFYIAQLSPKARSFVPLPRYHSQHPFALIQPSDRSRRQPPSLILQLLEACSGRPVPACHSATIGPVACHPAALPEQNRHQNVRVMLGV